MGSICTSMSSTATTSTVENLERESLATPEQRELSKKQALVLKPMRGARLASARIRRGDISEWYSFESKVLGTGFSGPVHLAVDKWSGRQYAVKPFSKLKANKDSINMLRNEASIYLRLDHPNIARLIEVWESAHDVYIVMEYCSGGELYDRLCTRKMYSEGITRHIAAQMFSAVNYLHNQKVVHRDLKSENWLYESTEEDSNLKLIDFGFSKMWDANQPKRMHATCGTLVYVSPDTLLGSYTNACDLWSLGVIIYMLLVGYPPFYGTEEEMFSRILEAQYSLSGPRWNRITPLGKEFVRRLLVKDASKRMTAKEALDHPWLSTVCVSIGPVLEPAVIESLRRYAQCTKFKRAILNLIAYSMTSSQIEDIRNVFLGIDKDKEGTIKFEEIREILSLSSPEISLAEVVKIFKALTGSEHGRISFNDFLSAMLTYKLVVDSDLLRHSFFKFDSDHSGFISFQNVKSTLIGDDRYTEAKITRMFAEADKDGNGLIVLEVQLLQFTPTLVIPDFEEFSRLVFADDSNQTVEDVICFGLPSKSSIRPPSITDHSLVSYSSPSSMETTSRRSEQGDTQDLNFPLKTMASRQTA